MEEISKIARIDACIWNEDIMVVIDTPLVSQETYGFYKMHPLPSQQYTQGNPLGLAAIRPRNTFVAINEQGTTHFKFNQEDLGANCIRRHYGWVCEAFVSLRSIVNETDCEVTLLTKHIVGTLRDHNNSERKHISTIFDDIKYMAVHDAVKTKSQDHWKS